MTYIVYINYFHCFEIMDGIGIGGRGKSIFATGNFVVEIDKLHKTFTKATTKCSQRCNPTK